VGGVMASATLTVRKRRPWSAVPDHLLTDTRLGFPARVAGGYCLGRPDGWVFHVGQLLAVLGLGVAQWRAARQQLIAAGYLEHRRHKDMQGRWVWTMVLNDEPTMVHFSADGEPVDGKPIDGQADDLAKDLQHLDGSTGAAANPREARAAADQGVKKRRRGDAILLHGIEVWTDQDRAGINKLVETYGADCVATTAGSVRPAQGHVAPYLSSVSAELQSRAASAAREAETRDALARQAAANKEALDKRSGRARAAQAAAVLRGGRAAA
jgi:hypothetical protein